MRKALLLLALLASTAEARTFAIASQDGVTVTLTDEPCALSAVTNLPNRATWMQAGQTIEGCFGANGTLIAAYFADKTVTILPVSVFRPAREM